MIDLTKFGIVDVIFDGSQIHIKPGIEEGIQYFSTETKRFIVEQIGDSQHCLIVAQWIPALNYYMIQNKTETHFTFWPGEMYLTEKAKLFLLGMNQ